MCLKIRDKEKIIVSYIHATKVTFKNKVEMEKLFLKKPLFLYQQP
jgi:hypothetical protein